MRYYNHDYTRLKRVKEWSDHYDAWVKRTRNRRPFVTVWYTNIRETKQEYNTRKGRIRTRILLERARMGISR